MFPVHVLDDVCIVLIDSDSLQDMSGHVVAVTDESPERESGWVFHANGLGQHHSSRLASVDEHAAVSPVLPQAVVHVLDEDSHREHDESRHQPCKEQLTEAYDGQPVVGVEEESERLHNHDSKHICRCNAVQVSKAGIAHDTTVGVEESEAYDIGNEIDDQRRNQIPKCEGCGKSSMRQCIYHQIGNDDDQTVEQKDYPIWHCIPCEIPICKFCEYMVHCEWIFSSILLRCFVSKKCTKCTKNIIFRIKTQLFIPRMKIIKCDSSTSIFEISNIKIDK